MRQTALITQQRLCQWLGCQAGAYLVRLCDVHERELVCVLQVLSLLDERSQFRLGAATSGVEITEFAHQLASFAHQFAQFGLHQGVLTVHLGGAHPLLLEQPATGVHLAIHLVEVRSPRLTLPLEFVDLRLCLPVTLPLCRHLFVQHPLHALVVVEIAPNLDQPRFGRLEFGLGARLFGEQPFERFEQLLSRVHLTDGTRQFLRSLCDLMFEFGDATCKPFGPRALLLRARLLLSDAQLGLVETVREFGARIAPFLQQFASGGDVGLQLVALGVGGLSP